MLIIKPNNKINKKNNWLVSQTIVKKQKQKQKARKGESPGKYNTNN